MPLRFVNDIFPFQSNLMDTLLNLCLPRHIRSPTPSSFRHFKIQCSSQNINIISSQTCPYHGTSLVIASPSKVSVKPSTLISSWLLLFSIILTPHIALILLFQLFSKLPSHSLLDTASRSHTALLIFATLINPFHF